MAESLNSKNITVQQTGKKSGKFVLFIRTGKNCPLCLEDYKDNEDIVVVLSRYQENNFPVAKEIWVTSGGLSKFDAARLFFHEFPEFMNCEAYAFFDPDVGISFENIHRLFQKGMMDRKAIYQAAVAPESHTVWKFLYTKNSPGWREVSFVEVMAPLFSREALASVVDGFSDSISTWGLEYAWYAKCKTSRIAVYDPIIMRHDTKVDTVDGPFYRYLAQMGINPSTELETLKEASVGRFYMECETPPWVPLRAKKHYVRMMGMTRLVYRRLESTRIWKSSDRLLAHALGNRLPKGR
jgi:hypothetical protein